MRIAPVYLVLLIAVAVSSFPSCLGNYLARALRMPDYGWKLALIFFAFWPACGHSVAGAGRRSWASTSAAA